MSKGYKGETCTQAIKAVIEPGDLLTAAELFNRVRSLGTWTEDTIWQHLIAHVVNHPAARHHYAGFEPFLYLHTDPVERALSDKDERGHAEQGSGEDEKLEREPGQKRDAGPGQEKGPSVLGRFEDTVSDDKEGDQRGRDLGVDQM